MVSKLLALAAVGRAILLGTLREEKVACLVACSTELAEESLSLDSSARVAAAAAAMGGAE